MIKSFLFSLIVILLGAGTIFANSNITQDISAEGRNPLREYAESTASSGSTLMNDNTTLNTSLKKSELPHAKDYGNDLSALVDTSKDSYNRLLAEAEKILSDGAPSKARKEIEKQQKTTDKEIEKEAGKIVNSKKKIDDYFKKSHDYYKGKTAKDYINQEVKTYNNDYKMANYDDLLDEIKTPEQIQKSFDEIDDDQNDDLKYKLSDGYSIEQITTVGLLQGNDKNLKKCLIMKSYGGGTWRTYCQPLKKPTQCPDYEWQRLTTMAIMYC